MYTRVVRCKTNDILEDTKIVLWEGEWLDISVHDPENLKWTFLHLPSEAWQIPIFDSYTITAAVKKDSYEVAQICFGNDYLLNWSNLFQNEEISCGDWQDPQDTYIFSIFVEHFSKRNLPLKRGFESLGGTFSAKNSFDPLLWLPDIDGTSGFRSASDNKDDFWIQMTMPETPEGSPVPLYEVSALEYQKALDGLSESENRSWIEAFRFEYSLDYGQTWFESV